MSSAIEAFAENAKLFCEWAESSTHDVQKARQLLLALMQGVPWLKSSTQMESDREYLRRGHDDWVSDHKRFADFPIQYYWMVSTTCVPDEETPVAGDIHDDLADIYGELWHGLQAWEQGDSTYATGHWHQSYFQHWGHHASTALCAIDEHYRKNNH